MPKHKQPSKTNGKYYKVILFYARAYQPTFYSELQARRFLQARALTSKACHYAELWKMSNESDGEQVAVFENSQLELVLK